MPLRTDRAATINPPDVRLNIDQNIAWRKRRVRHNELLNASPWCHPGPRTANASRSAQPPPAEHTACTPRDTSDPKCIREKPPLGVPLGATGDSQACAPPSEWGWGHRLRLYTSHYVSRGQTTVQPLFAFYASRLIYVDGFGRARPSPQCKWLVAHYPIMVDARVPSLATRRSGHLQIQIHTMVPVPLSTGRKLRPAPTCHGQRCFSSWPFRPNSTTRVSPAREPRWMCCGCHNR